MPQERRSIPVKECLRLDIVLVGTLGKRIGMWQQHKQEIQYSVYFKTEYTHKIL